MFSLLYIRDMAHNITPIESANSARRTPPPLSAHDVGVTLDAITAVRQYIESACTYTMPEDASDDLLDAMRIIDGLEDALNPLPHACGTV